MVDQDANIAVCVCPPSSFGFRCEGLLASISSPLTTTRSFLRNVSLCEHLQGACLNGGSCVDNDREFVCHCLRGYTGSLCQHHITTSVGDNNCMTSPCANGGLCAYVAEDDDFHCVCPPGLGGTDCRVEHDCRYEPCLRDGVCTTSRACICADGIFGSRCEFDSRKNQRLSSSLAPHENKSAVNVTASVHEHLVLIIGLCVGICLPFVVAAVCCCSLPALLVRRRRQAQESAAVASHISFIHNNCMERPTGFESLDFTLRKYQRSHNSYRVRDNRNIEGFETTVSNLNNKKVIQENSHDWKNSPYRINCIQKVTNKCSKNDTKSSVSYENRLKQSRTTELLSLDVVNLYREANQAERRRTSSRRSPRMSFKDSHRTAARLATLSNLWYVLIFENCTNESFNRIKKIINTKYNSI